MSKPKPKKPKKPTDSEMLNWLQDTGADTICHEKRNRWVVGIFVAPEAAHGLGRTLRSAIRKAMEADRG